MFESLNENWQFEIKRSDSRVREYIKAPGDLKVRIANLNQSKQSLLKLTYSTSTNVQ